MDNALQAQYSGIGRIPYTPRTRQSSASSIVSGRKPLKKLTGSGRFSLSGRSNQSTTQIVARSENNIIESFGLPLPVLVNEALTFFDRNAVVSIGCSPFGWAWAACGRRLLVWQYKESNLSSPKMDSMRSSQRRIATGQCRELTLPHCDIGHKASLVTVFMGDGQQMASCLAVSPTGDVRYWPSIAHDGSSIDETGILEGQEFDELLSISPVGYLLATTTCNLVLLQIQLNGGRHALVHQAIKPPTGFLGGIGKKFASIIIGINSSQDKENKFIKICAEKHRTSDWIVSILADKWIQRWHISVTGTESFRFQDFELFRKVRDAFHQKLWNNRDANEVEIKFLDMQSMATKLIILAAAVNVAHTPQIYYALITISDDGSTTSVTKYCQINYNSFYTGNSSTDNIRMKFILNRGVAYVYDDRTIYQIFTNDLGCDETEKIEFPAQSDKIMAAAVHNNIPLFFSRLYGLVCVSPVDTEAGDFFNNSELFAGIENSFLSQSMHYPGDHGDGNMTIYDLNPDDMSRSTDDISQLKAAFIYHLKKNSAKCFAILSELFSATTDDDGGGGGGDGPHLDGMVVSIARDLAEDIPAADPRWEQMSRSGSQHGALGSSASMQIISQLKEKSKAFNLFVDFLHVTELWDKLAMASDRGGNTKATCHLLADIGEKIVASIALKRTHNSHAKLVDDAINTVLLKRNEQIGGTLTQQDLFYVRITRVHEIFSALAAVADELIQSEQSSGTISTVLGDVNTVVLTILSDVTKFRESMHSQFATTRQAQFEYQPWTASSGKNGIRDVLLHLISVTLKHGARGTGEPELRQRHYKQLVDLIDFVLDGRRTYLDRNFAYLESNKNGDKYGVLLQQYESQRTELISPLVADGQYELAAKLAEKYFDFQTLVQICDVTENQPRLDEYIEKYKDMNFSQFAINWHLRQNKRGDLFARFKHNQADLTKFLGDHPSLAWVQSVFNGDLTNASKILFMLAQTETELMARKKTVLSLAKLTALASTDELSVHISHINSELTLIGYQENLPKHLLMIFGYDTESPKVLKPEEIIHLLIAAENETATEYDYRKALELLMYVDDSIDVRHKIWCSAILRDNWSTYNANSPLDDLQNMMLFKLIDLCFFLDAEIEDFLPPIEDFLEAPELEPLTADKSFQFLLKLGYEHIFEAYKTK